MPAFATPEPIFAVVDLVVGDVRIVASDRSDTVVDMRPSDPSRRADATATEEARVECSAGRLLVKTVRRWRSFSPFSDGGSVDVEIELPTGSRLTADGSMATFRCTGSLGDCRIKSGLGDVQVEAAAAVQLTTGAGTVAVERASGNAELTTGSGEVRAGAIDGAAVVKNSNGDCYLGEVAGELRVKAANGDIAIEHAHGSLTAATANGDIRVGAVSRGSVSAETGFGQVEIAVPDGTAAWLDLSTGYGRLHNELNAVGPPTPDDDTVEVRARSGYGDITIRHADPPASIAPIPHDDQNGDSDA